MPTTSRTAKPRPAKREVLHCFDCDQVCCRTAVVEVEPPRSLRDYSDLLFYLHHHDTQIVVARNGRKREWYVEFMAACRYIDSEGRCTIYERRPLVCREYDMMYCERNALRPFAYMRTPEEFYDFLRTDGRKRILDKLLATHVLPRGRARKSPRASGGRRASK